ncbi:hypothetical protein B4U80_07476 [Leptotrombidium deliense]|uniref:Telomere length regulation protein conserved domain-containing protein n=1 Tax=Leptotrombidium deliense TaxID=299467 RepID=A0A443SSC2_9ACAR|nr:hypothetical protein B4U80_07476 [Leptotrombidium deliense]
MLLVSCFEESTVVKNIVEYLAIYSKQHFLEAIRNVLNAWCNSLSIKYRTKAQHVYLSSILLIASKYLPNCEFERYRQEYINATMHGIQLFLKCSLPDIRSIGLFVGQTLITCIQTDGPKLDFEVEDTEEIQNLKLLLNEPVIDHEVDMNVFDVLQETINDTENRDELQDSANIAGKSNDDDDSDDDIFVAGDLSGDVPLAKSRKPVYLRDCMQGLMDDEKPDWAIICLQSAADVIKANTDIVGEVAVEFTTTLLYLNDNYSIDNFDELRLSAMVALCVASPRSVSEYLTSQFYDRNLSISRRVDILEVLGVSCQQIKDASKNEEKMKCLALSSSETSIAEEDWKVVINARLKQKTRIIASKSREPEASINKFASVAGYFFYPLMKNYNEINITFNLEEDHYLLGKLLYTLGIVLHCASQTWPSRQMGKSLLQFLWAFRYHEQVFVRQSAIFCFSVVITAVPSFYLLNELKNEILESQQWLLDVVENDSNSDCVKRSFQTLNLLRSLVKSEVS